MRCYCSLPSAAKGHPRADRHPLSDLELRHRLAGAANLRALPGDDGQLVDRGVELLRVGLRLADAHVERDLLDARDIHHRGDPELLLQRRAKLLLVELLEARRVGDAALGLGITLGRRAALSRHYRSISSPQSARLQTRTLICSPWDSLSFIPTRVGRLQTGQTTMTFPTGSGAGLSTTPPGVMPAVAMRVVFLVGGGFVCRLTMFRFSTTTLPALGRASMTRPCLPRSLPLKTWTRSPLRTRIVWDIR